VKTVKTKKPIKDKTIKSKPKKVSYKNKVESIKNNALFKNKKFLIAAGLILFSGIGSYLVFFSKAANPVTNIPPAPSVYFSPTSQTLDQNTTFTTDVYENSGTTSVNAIQANFTYDKTKYSYVSLDTSTSAFPIQAENIVDTTNGIIKLARGTTTPLAGPQLVARVTLKVVSTTGTGAISFTTGTQLLSSTTNNNILPGTTAYGNASYSIITLTAPPLVNAGCTANTYKLLTPNTNNVCVKYAQQLLNRTPKQYYASTIDGLFGPVTDTAVKNFKVSAWPQQPTWRDGALGPLTWTRLCARAASGVGYFEANCPSAVGHYKNSTNKGADVINIASSYVGASYSDIDHSLFTRTVYLETLGIELPRTITAQKDWAVSRGKVLADVSKAVPGDLIWVNSIVGIYAGNGNFYAAQDSTRPLSLRPYPTNTTPTFIRVW
jgi:cell wall-associated NlpC family hydrolase